MIVKKQIKESMQGYKINDINVDISEVKNNKTDAGGNFYTYDLFNKNGLLLATSRPEIFTFSLVGKRINPIALHEIQHNHVSQFIHKEQISSMEFTYAYAQFLNNDVILVLILFSCYSLLFHLYQY